MRRIMLVLLGLAATGCASGGDIGDFADNKVAKGAAIGAAGGAVAGAVVPGVSAVEGAVAGAAVGAVAGALSKEDVSASRRGEGWALVDDSVRGDREVGDRVLARYDRDGDSELDRREGELAARDLDRMLDTDNNGSISGDELAQNRDYALRNL